MNLNTNNTLYIYDIKFTKLSNNIINQNINNINILSLSPYSSYQLVEAKSSFITFHDFISTSDYRDMVLNLEYKFIKYFETITDLGGMFRVIQQLVNKYTFLNILYKISKKYKKVIYITDYEDRIKYIEQFAEIKFIKKKDKGDFKKQSKIIRLLNMDKGLLYNKIVCKYIYKLKLNYDWSYYIDVFKHTQFYLNKEYQYNLNFDNKIVEKLVEGSFFINSLLDELNSFQFSEKLEMNYYLPFTDANIIENNLLIREYKKNNLLVFFYQHGSYFYTGRDLQYVEINNADINFVFNDYTKKLFESLGAKKVYSVGSILFNRKIKERKKEYDYLYITQGHDYTGNIQYVDFPNSLHSFDGYELYQRHKAIIELFGTKFRKKKIIIRVHPTVVTVGMYVPFWELAEQYPNITIDVSIPIHTLIEKSKYIISDYFTTEFINRELHYKRDIILFQGAPTPLPEETIEDMNKMFLLVDTIDDLEEKVGDIENITKNRKRYDDIIEYYSSKKCDTKKVVTEILEKELNART